MNKEKTMNMVYEQTRKNPRTGFTETIFTHLRKTFGYKFTGKTLVNNPEGEKI